MFGLSFGELLLVALVVLLVFGPRRFVNLGRDIQATFDNFRTGGKASARPEPVATPARRQPRSRARAAGAATRKLFAYSTPIGWSLTLVGFGLILGDLYWWHWGTPMLALGTALLFLGISLIVFW
ncbi:MAG: twin-arginine translocase TatA/TatE family subunit [Chloroflexi bacterium]|nr:twin-arginine translocase TatA/TatE family subunit [Chloroflexota bacterium]